MIDRKTDYFVDDAVFGQCRLGADGLLSTPSSRIQLSSRQTRLLRGLVQARGKAVPSDLLMDQAWGAGAGTLQGLAKAIFHLRSALASDDGIRIESVYGHGYRLHVESAQPGRPDAKSRALAICEEAALRIHSRLDVTLKSAQAMYQEATQLDPSCIRAHLGYANAALHLTASGWQSGATAWPPARQAIDDALVIEPNNAEALAFRGFGECIFGWQFEDSEAAFQQAIDLAPTNYAVHELAGRSTLFRGLTTRAIHHLTCALDANPMSLSGHGLLALALGFHGDLTGAFEQIALMRRLDPANRTVLNYEAWLEARFGDPEAACRLTEVEHETIPDSSIRPAFRALALARAGHHAAARALLATFEDTGRYSAPHSAMLAYAWTALDEPDAAVRALSRAAEDRDYWLGGTLSYPLDTALRSHTGFAAVYRKVFGPHESDAQLARKNRRRT